MNEYSKPSTDNSYLATHVALVLNSYEHWCKAKLIENGPEQEDAKNIFYAPYALLSHNANVDPVFTYANKTALNLFEFEWQDLISTHSRYSAESVNRSAREQMLKDVSEHGYTNQYSGIRISSSGRRFRIHQAVVWNLIDAHGNYQGQAAMFNDWTFLDS